MTTDRLSVLLHNAPPEQGPGLQPAAVLRAARRRQVRQRSLTGAALGLTALAVAVPVVGALRDHTEPSTIAQGPAHEVKVNGHFAPGGTGGVVSGQRVTVLPGLDRSFPMFGADDVVTAATADEDGNFALVLAPGEYTVGAYTVSFARSRIPCVTQNLVVDANGPAPALSLTCERQNASPSPS